jgi:hypothetical protein
MMEGNAPGQTFDQLMVFSNDLLDEWYMLFINDVLTVGQRVNLPLLCDVADLFREGLALCWPRGKDKSRPNAGKMYGKAANPPITAPLSLSAVQNARNERVLRADFQTLIQKEKLTVVSFPTEINKSTARRFPSVGLRDACM